MKKETKFWIIWGPKGQTNPKVVFKDEEEAIQAAGKMATFHKGQDFYVMLAVAKVGVPEMPIKTRRLK